MAFETDESVLFIELCPHFRSVLIERGSTVLNTPYLVLNVTYDTHSLFIYYSVESEPEVAPSNHHPPLSRKTRSPTIRKQFEELGTYF